MYCLLNFLKLLYCFKYYVNNCYSDVSCVKMRSSVLSDLETIWETPTGLFPNKILIQTILELDIFQVTCRKAHWCYHWFIILDRCYVSVAVVGELVYAMGGYDGHHRQNTAEHYNYKTNQWSLIAPMNVQRSDASATTLNGQFNNYLIILYIHLKDF